MTTDDTRLGQDLAALARTDPEVRAAEEALDRLADSIRVRRDVPRTRFRPSTADRPCEVIR